MSRTGVAGSRRGLVERHGDLCFCWCCGVVEGADEDDSRRGRVLTNPSAASSQ